MQDDSQDFLIEQVQQALSDNEPLNITGGNSKSFYGRTVKGKPLELGQYQGVVSYEPSELVITVKAGTKISKIESLLAEHNQMLGFEPAYCNEHSTIGGVVASGLAGARRPYAGAVRDFILGVKIINGRAEALNFGGQVMKNVAGFDHSRLMAGSLGTLAVILEVSLRVLPRPKLETTIKLDCPDPRDAILLFNQLAGKPYPLSAAAWVNSRILLRFSGTEVGVNSAIEQINGQSESIDNRCWTDLNQHQADDFKTVDVLYRASVVPACPVFSDPTRQIIDWGGAQRWMFDLKDIDTVRETIQAYGGSLMVFRGGDRSDQVFQQPDPVTMRLYKNIKQAFDPKHIFNPGRMYKEI